MLAIPLFDLKSNRVIGAIHFLNKVRSGVVYSESDEIFGQMLGDHVSALVSSCTQHERVESRSDMLAGLLDASASIYDVVSADKVFDMEQQLQPGDLLRALENLCCSALKCTKSRYETVTY